MDKEEAREKLRSAESDLRVAEIVSEKHEKAIREIKEYIEKLKAFINKKDDWRNGLAKPGADPCLRMLLPTGREYYYRTSEQLGIANKKVQLLIEMLQFAHVRNEGWEADWGDKDECKWGIIFNENDEGACVKWLYITNRFIFGIAVKSEEIAEEMVDEFGERIEEIYNKQY